MIHPSSPRVPIVDLCVSHVDCVNRTAPIVDGPTPYKMIRTTNVKDGFIDVDNVRYVTEATYKKWTRRLTPQRGDVILTREAPLGDVGKLRTDDHVFLGQRLYHFRPDPSRVDTDFLMYSLMAPDLQGQIRSFGSGATVEHMRLADIPNLKMSVPPLSVQRQIGQKLAAYDELIENNLRRIKILEETTRALYREWFDCLRYPGLGSRRPSTGLPQRWSKRKLSDITSFLSRGIAPRYAENGDYVVINQRCIRDQRLDLGESRRQSKPVPPQRHVTVGDVLVNSTGVGTLGRVAQVTMEIANTTVDTHVTIVRSQDWLDSDFFGLSLLERQSEFERLGVGATGQTELSRAAIGAVEIVVPPASVCTEFGAAVRPMRELAAVLMRQIGVSRETRNWLLPRLIAGHIDPGDLGEAA